MKIGGKCSPGEGTIHFNLRTTDRDGAVGGDRGRSLLKAMKIGGKWFSGEGAIHFNLRTTHRDGAVGGDREKEVY